MVCAGLKRDVGDRVSDIEASACGVAQCHHLGMRFSSGLGVALAEQLPIRADDQATDTWVGVRQAHGLFSQPECLQHGLIRERGAVRKRF